MGEKTDEEMADSETNKKELREMLNKCLGELSSKHREILILYYFEDMDYKEIAEDQGITKEVLQQRMKDAQTAQLKTQLEVLVYYREGVS